MTGGDALKIFFSGAAGFGFGAPGSESNFLASSSGIVAFLVFLGAAVGLALDFAGAALFFALGLAAAVLASGLAAAVLVLGLAAALLVFLAVVLAATVFVVLAGDFLAGFGFAAFFGLAAAFFTVFFLVSSSFADFVFFFDVDLIKLSLPISIPF
ncbi:MAG: hypothetical protein PVG41_10285 [Desulfobacteraceae bacterium]